MKKIFMFLLFLQTTASFAQQKNIISDEHVAERKVDAFQAIMISGPFTVHFSSGSEYQLAVSATDAAARERIITQVKDGKLEIRLDGNSWKNWKGNSKFTVYVSSPEIKSIVASGAVDFDIHDLMKTKKLDLIFSGASDFSGNIEASSLSATFSGGSDMNVKGKVSNLKLIMSGASDCKCYGLSTDIADIIASGASNVQIYVNQSITAVASGASDVEYKGSPTKTQTRASGASSVTKKG